MLKRKNVHWEPTALQHTTRTCLMQKKFASTLKIPARETLMQLKKRIQLHQGKTKTYKEEVEDQMIKNNEMIENLRNEIREKRTETVCPGQDELLMRKALSDHHPGNNIFREKEPRDVSKQIDFKTGDLLNRLNHLKHDHTRRSEYLAKLLTLFNDNVEDVVYLELEGPMGDSRCLAIENHICDIGKKYLQAETLRNTYKHVRDQLAIERQMNEVCIETINSMLQAQEKELATYQQEMDVSRHKKENAIAAALKTEVDNHSNRKRRESQAIACRKQAEEHRTEFNHLRRHIHAYFANQEAGPLVTNLSHTSHGNNSGLERFSVAEQGFNDLEEETQVLIDVTGNHTIQETAERYEKQRDTYEHLKAMAREMEVKKSEYLDKLKALSVMMANAMYRDQLPEDRFHQQASADRDRLVQTVSQRHWSSLAATSRITQSLARLRQLLEYLVSVMAAAHLVSSPLPRKKTRVDTLTYLPAMLELTRAGANQLIASFGFDGPEKAHQQAIQAHFMMTNTEKKMSTVVPPWQVYTTTTDDGETTGDDVSIAVRIAMKQQARLLVQAKLKAGLGKKRFV